MALKVQNKKQTSFDRQSDIICGR